MPRFWTIRYFVVGQRLGVKSKTGMRVALNGLQAGPFVSNANLPVEDVMTPGNAIAVTRSVQFGGENWEVTDRSLAGDTASTSSNLLAFQSAGGFVLHRYAHCAMNALSDRDLRDLLLLALLSHS